MTANTGVNQAIRELDARIKRDYREHRLVRRNLLVMDYPDLHRKQHEETRRDLLVDSLRRANAITNVLVANAAGSPPWQQGFQELLDYLEEDLI